MTERISNESLYAEFRNELRRYRDYELTAATWYTSILIALFGFYISISKPLFQTQDIKFIVAGLSLLLGLSSWYSIWFAHKRHDFIRDILEKHLEPTWKIIAFMPMSIRPGTITERIHARIKPRFFIYTTQLVIVLATLYVICFK